MLAFFYIGKRALADILRTSVFWVALGLISIIIFSILYWGWHAVESEVKDHPKGFQNAFDEDPDLSIDPLDMIQPETMIMWNIYMVTIGFTNLLSIFIMMGILGRELDRKTVDLLIARPVTRGHIFFGKLFAGWAAIALFMAITGAWTLACMEFGGMGADFEYLKAIGVGILSPIILSSICLVLSMWMWSYLAGLLTMIITFASGTGGIIMMKLIGIELLKFDVAIKIIIRALPPMSVIGQTATEYLDFQLWVNMIKFMFDNESLPGPADGLYTEMWHVFAYLGGILLIGWLSFFRRQFD